MNLLIFKAYDIRGVYPSELDEATAYAVGQAFVLMTQVNQVVVGRDMRLSSSTLFESLVKGITSAGAEVVDIGEVPIDAVYFAVNHYNYQSGIMITASHNPKEYNGFKMVKKTADGFVVLRGTELVEYLDKKVGSVEMGRVRELDVMAEFVEHVLSFSDISKIKPLKVVVDAGNGMAGKMIPLLEKYVPVEITKLFFELDGNFPNHPSNPLEESSQKIIGEKIREVGADAGFIFDGDSDRIFLYDENGRIVFGDISLILLARQLLSLPENKGKAVAYNAICSRSVADFVLEFGGVPIKTPVGFVNIQKGLQENNGIVGGEVSGHYAFANNFCADSGYIAWLILLEIISQDGRPVSEIVATYNRYVRSPETNIKLNDKDLALKKFQEYYQAWPQDLIDGITVNDADWWINVRPSNTEPLLRVTVEGKDQATTDFRLNEVLGVIKE
ncbi:MAG: phosphomannomutase/phosphoglucomutase [Candidatus Falkowbacteria bacterium]